MEARKLLYSAMAVGPVLLMAAIGVHARTYVDPYDWPETPEDHKRISAYIAMMPELEDMYYRKAATEGRAREVAQAMIDGRTSGSLKPLTPRNVDEFMPLGIKGKLIDLGQAPARRLMEYAATKIENHDLENASIDLQLASDSLNTLKYSNFMVLYRTSLTQGYILQMISEIYPKVSPDSQERLRACMERMKGSTREYARMASKAKQVIIAQYREYEDVNLALEAASKLVPEPSFFEQPAQAKTKFIHQGAYRLDQTIIPNQRVEARQSMLTDQKNRLAIEMITSPSRARNARLIVANK